MIIGSLINVNFREYFYSNHFCFYCEYRLLVDSPRLPKRGQLWVFPCGQWGMTTTTPINYSEFQSFIIILQIMFSHCVVCYSVVAHRTINVPALFTCTIHFSGVRQWGVVLSLVCHGRITCASLVRHRCDMDASLVCRWCITCASLVRQGCFTGVSWVHHLCVTGASRMRRRCDTSCLHHWPSGGTSLLCQLCVTGACMVHTHSIYAYLRHRQ